MITHDLLRIRITDWYSDRTEITRLREQVFVHEQGVPPELEIDASDPICIHILAEYGNETVGTGRLTLDGHIGRLAVLREYRRQGIGKTLLDRLTREATHRGINQVCLNAQIQAIPFYEQAGFKISSEEFLDAGIPHRAMCRYLGSN